MRLPQRWLEPGFLAILFAAACALLVFLTIASEVSEGDTGALDTTIMLALHPADHSDRLLGPRWLWEVARDITGLGSTVVLGLLVLATFIGLLLARRYRTACYILAATTLGAAANSLLKVLFNRPRPDLIPHDLYVHDTSFPSGHAMLSATVYLTLGALLSRLAPSLRVKIFILSMATLLSGLVGVSRVYLGVHWPSDVVAGWAAGAAWAWGASALAQAIHIGTGAKR